MESKKNKSISTAIQRRLETIPGIVSFASILEAKKEKVNDWIQIHEEDGGLNISIGVVINRNVTTINLSKEIYAAILFELKQMKLTLKKFNFYIRGVK